MHNVCNADASSTNELESQLHMILNELAKGVNDDALLIQDWSECGEVCLYTTINIGTKADVSSSLL